MIENTLGNRVITGLKWSAGLRFLGQLLTWAITIVVMRKLSPEDYGLMGMAGVAITYIATINELGLGAAIIQKRNLNDRMLRQIFGLLILINFGLFLVCFLFGPIVSGFFSEPRLILLIRCMAIQFIIASFAIIPQSLVGREMRFRQKAIVDLVSVIGGSFASLALALSGFGVWSLVWGSITITLFRTAGLNFIQPYFRLPSFSFDKLREHISFGGSVTVTRILWLLYSQSDKIIVGKLLGKELLGFYSVALTLASLPMEKVSGIINQVAFPAFATIQEDTQQAASHFLKAVRLMTFLAFPVLWGISSVATQLVHVLLGNKWEMSIIPLQILSLVIPFRMVSNLMGPALLGLGRPDSNLYNAITGALILPFGFLVGSLWGIDGISLAWAVLFPCVFLINLSRIDRILEVRMVTVFNAMSRPLIGSVVMYIMVIAINGYFSKSPAIISLILPILAGGLVYCGSLFILGRETYHETVALLKK